MKVLDYACREDIKRLIERSSFDSGQVMESVRDIITDVRARGDAALIEYTDKFDGVDLHQEGIRVPKKEIDSAAKKIDKALLSALQHSYRNILKYHQKQHKSLARSFKAEIEPGISIEERTSPLESVGAYVPGGRAAYPSTVLMNAVPAKVAGVKRIVVVSPPEISPAVLAACRVCEVDEVYRVGGAQAIAALAYGTQSIPKVDKIVGPGNKYVTCAKLLVYGSVSIDMPAGPSEVLIIGDSSTDPGLVAADILAQAEHDPDARCVYATDSASRITEVVTEVRLQMKGLSRGSILKKSLESAAIVHVRSMDEAAEFANEYAPEHLEILARNPAQLAKKIRNAGTIFVGPYAPVPAGDYASGGNHVLPTGGAARFSSGLSVRDFLRSYSLQSIDRKGLARIRRTVSTLACAESLDAHARSVEKRFH